jgi:23S rRNA (uracil1939-C5)-methyltransferase
MTDRDKAAVATNSRGPRGRDRPDGPGAGDGRGGIPLAKGRTVRIQIAGLSHSGEGVGRFRNFTIFVPYAVPGDTADVRIEEVHTNYARGELAFVRSPSPNRVQPRCGLFYDCGGCQLQQVDYRTQLVLKTKVVEDAVTRLGRLEGVDVKPCLGAKDPWYYRNKVQFPVGTTEGRLIVGCYAKGTHEIVPVEECAIQHQTNNRIMRESRILAEKYNLPPYDEATGKGVLRHILSRVAAKTGQAMVVFVTATRDLPQGRQIADELMLLLPQVVGVFQNINPARTNVIMGPETRLLAGQESIEDTIHVGGLYEDLRFKISPQSFYQTNPEQTGLLYRQVLKYADLTYRETVIDVYSGIGTIALFLAQRAQKAYGIESVAEAVNDAKRNARLNRIENAEFLVGEAEKIMPQMRQGGVTPDLIVVDPPRKGCDERVLRAMAEMHPKRIIYVSCNPATLARDLAALARLGYRTTEVQPVDMFPMTGHVESIAQMRQEEIKKVG